MRNFKKVSGIGNVELSRAFPTSRSAECRELPLEKGHRGCAIFGDETGGGNRKFWRNCLLRGSEGWGTDNATSFPQDPAKEELPRDRAESCAGGQHPAFWGWSSPATWTCYNPGEGLPFFRDGCSGRPILEGLRWCFLGLVHSPSYYPRCSWPL